MNAGGNALNAKREYAGRPKERLYTATLRIMARSRRFRVRKVREQYSLRAAILNVFIARIIFSARKGKWTARKITALPMRGR